MKGYRNASEILKTKEASWDVLAEELMQKETWSLEDSKN